VNQADREAMTCIENKFMDAVWDALKTRTNDLRRQQRILSAFRLATASLNNLRQNAPETPND